MSSIHERALSGKQVRLAVGNREFIFPRSSIVEELGVKSIIRIPKEEYPEKATRGSIFTHFNLPVPSDFTGTRAVLSRILENGYFKTSGEEKLPLLSFSNVWLVNVTKQINFANYDSFSPEIFERTIGGVRNVDELKKLILSRYSKSIPDFDEKGILSQGLSVRFLELLKLVTI